MKYLKISLFILLLTLTAYSISWADGGCKIHKTAVNWSHIRGECNGGYAHGFGEASGSGGRYFIGEFDKGRFLHGMYMYNDGSLYYGPFVKGRFHGVGMMITPKGKIFIGSFVKGQYNWRKNTYQKGKELLIPKPLEKR